MKPIVRAIAAVVLSLATVATPLSLAQANDQLGGDSDAIFRLGKHQNDYYVVRDRHGRHGHVRRGWRHGGPRVIYRERRGDAAAAAILGLGAAAIIGGAIANSNRNVAPNYYRVAPSGASGYEPWSPGWYRYCAQRYRSFNAATGTFRGYDGRDHFCVVN